MRGRAAVVVLMLGGLGMLAWQTREVEPEGVPVPGPSAVRAENGLVWEDVVVGTGRPPAPQQIAVIRYTAWDGAGKVLASATEERPLQFTFGKNETLPAFEQGMAGMKEGGRRRLWLPASLSYQGFSAPGIAPATPLVFDLTLLDVEGKEEGPFPEGRNTVAP